MRLDTLPAVGQAADGAWDILNEVFKADNRNSTMNAFVAISDRVARIVHPREFGDRVAQVLECMVGRRVWHRDEMNEW
jgi:hypothetical protein